VTLMKVKSVVVTIVNTVHYTELSKATPDPHDISGYL
jgi:hypothetical protein